MELQPVYNVSEPSSRRLSAGGAAHFSVTKSISTDCWPGMHPVYMVSESTSGGLSARGAACLYGFRTYLQETVSQGCSLFIHFPNLPPVDCWAGVQPVNIVSEPAFRGLSARDQANLYGSQPPSKDCLLGVQPVYKVSEPTSRGLQPGMQPVFTVSEHTPRGLLFRGAACL